MVDSAYGMPRRSATRATALSPSWFMSRVKPVGAKANGMADGCPSIVVDMSTSATSRRIEGWNSSSLNRSRARFRLISAPAAPSV
jgi:hypothetical protein